MILHKLVKSGIAIVLVAAVAGGVFLVYRHFKGRRGDRPEGHDMQRLIEDVGRNDIVNTITASGTVMLNNEVEVYAEGETNKIQEFHVEEGDTVSEGDLLVTYDTDDTVEELENKIRDTKRDIENAELNLKNTQLPTSDSDLLKLQNEVASAEKSLSESENNIKTIQNNIKTQNSTIATAKKDWEDAQKTVSDNAVLLEAGGISQEEYDNSVTSCSKAEQTYNNALSSLDTLNINLENAQKNVTTAENTLALAKTSLSEAENKLDLEENKIKIQQQKLTLQGLQDTLADAQKDLSEIVYSTYSNVSGVVTEVCVDEGTYTEENTVMLKVADLNDLIVSANIEEYDAPLLALGQKVTMTSDGLEGKVYTGEITKINITASNASSNMGTETVVPIEISVDNPDGILKQNYNLDLEIETTNKENVLSVSSTAIGTDGKTDENYVYKVVNDVLRKTVVETGDSDDTNTEILSGLNDGDRVVSTVSDNIKDGITVAEFTAQSQSQEGDTSKSKEAGNDDRDKQSNQMLPSGDFGGGRSGGGMPPGGGR
jgi:RND family efflux transporter MFP subunit